MGSKDNRYSISTEFLVSWNNLPADYYDISRKEVLGSSKSNVFAVKNAGIVSDVILTAREFIEALTGEYYLIDTLEETRKVSEQSGIDMSVGYKLTEIGNIPESVPYCLVEFSTEEDPCVKDIRAMVLTEEDALIIREYSN